MEKLSCTVSYTAMLPWVWTFICRAAEAVTLWELLTGRDLTLGLSVLSAGLKNVSV